MKKFILLAAVFLLQLSQLSASIGNCGDRTLSCTPTITTGTIANTTICAGTVIAVPFAITDCVDPGNVFTAQLSDVSGNFAAPTDIGTLAGTSISGSIVAIIPPSVNFGSGYRIRVICSSPLTVGTDNGVDLVLLPKPNATFSINNNAQCLTGNSFILSNSSTGSITSYKWNLGDGITTTNTNVNYTYASSGVFNATLTAIGTNGCRDSLTLPITVHPKPTVNFTIGGPNLCAAPDFVFTNTSTIATGTQTFSWNFGDGNTSILSSPSHSYPASAATYSVKLVSTSNNGCKDSISKVVTVLETPVASYLINNATQCLSGNSFSFPNFSFGTNNSYLWSFGDGVTSTATNAFHTYFTAGVFTVKLLVTNVNGCKDSSSKTVTVLANPVAGFNVVGGGLCSTNLTVAFNNSSTGNGNSYTWNFGDLSSSTTASPSKAYSSLGTYTVKLVATSSNGCKDSISQNIAIAAKPTAAFSINNNTQCVNNNLFAFTNNTTVGTFATSTWNFGDGITSSLTSPSKAYSTAGTYNVKLLVTNANGCSDSISLPITVVDKPNPNFTINGNTSCSASLNVSFNNTSTNATSYVWNFGNGSTSTATNPSTTYPSTSSYIIRLVATNSFGCKDSTERSITFASKPTAGFTINNNNQCVGSNSFSFTDTSIGAISYDWSFGDGITSTLQNPSKFYTTAGTYIVKLVVTNSSGCKDSVSQSITVAAKPTPDFTISGASGCSSNLNIQLINLSSGSTPTYSWNFGDGTTSTATNPSKTYTVAGLYTIKLVVTNANGCKDSTSKSFTLSQKPVVDFTINNNSQCVNNNTFILTNTTVGATAYSWSFGDGGTAITQDVNKSYFAIGTYTIKLMASNPNGCIDSLSKTVTVVPKPNAGFTTSGATGCTTNRIISLTNTSTGTGNTYSWDFGDGNTSTSTNPVANYAAAGAYTIKLVVTNINGCKDSTTQNITFNTFPVAAVSLANGTNSTQCFNGNSFTFNNTSTGGTHYYWSYGDGTTSFQTTILPSTKQYTAAGVYTVKLLVQNITTGCKDSTTTTVTVLASPTASYTYTGATECTNNRTINFTSTSTAGNYFWDFGDGTSTIGANTSRTYTTVGTYAVVLRVVGANTCRDSVTQIVSFKSVPTAVIAFAGSTTQCVNSNAYLFIDNSTGASTYSWNFGDGTTSTFKSPSVKVYTVAGNYVVKHFATSSDGCTDSTTLNVSILAAPIPNFTISGLDFCGNNLPITFNNTSTGTGNTYLWRLGDGTTSTATSPTKTYTVTGSYNVKLIVTSANGCADSVTQIVQFAPKVTAGINLNIDGSFIAGPPLGSGASKCFKGNSFAFQNNTTGSNSSTTYLWEYQDGTTSTLTNPPAHTYANIGKYNVKLTATNANGCVDSIRLTVSVLGNPVPNFTINGGGCTSSLGIDLVNTSVPANGLIFSNWNFGDATTSTVNNPTKFYAAKGTYQIRLVVNDSYCYDTLIKPVSFYQVPAVGINFVSNHTQCLNGNSYTVSNNSFFTTSYLWRFGDGTTSTSPTPPAKTYTAAGVYTITLIGTTIDGCKDSTTETATVIANPNAAFTATYQSCGNTNVRFVQIDSSTTSFSAWYFGDGNGPNDVSSANHTYATRGSYIVKYFAYDATFTCVDSATQIVTFAPLPVAGITHLGSMSLTQCKNGNSFTFFDASTNASSYLWNFGDGTTSTLANPPTYSYAAAGNYTIKLVTTSAAGCKDSTTQNVSVNPSPDASFSLGYNACNFTAQFYQLAIANTTTSVWDFGDGSGVNAAIPAVLTHTYPGAGTYILKHFATSVNGCVDSSSVTLTATPKPIAAINSAGINLTQCLNSNSFTFANNSTTATSYTWHFGDGDSATATNPTHHYTAAGTYTVKLFASTITGCKDSTTLVVTVLPSPQAAFVTTYNACGLSAQFVQTTTAITAFGVWDFGDGNTVNGGTPQNHTYPSIGTYTVKHFVYDGTATCSDSSIQIVTFFATPVAGINLSSASSQCLNSNNFLFADNSTNATTHSWNFGDGTTSTLANPPSHTYVSPGTYTIKHIAFNSSCKDSTTFTVNVLANPNATFSTNYVACNNLTAQFAQTNNANTLSSTWSFGDGNTTNNVTSTSHTYPSIGSYIVKYVARNATCSDSSTQTITFTTVPVAGINSSSLSSQCLNGNSFTFTDNSTNAATYSWSFGDGSTSTLTNPPTHTYITAGTYTVKLIVTNINGCADSVTRTVNVVAKPVAAFTTNGATNCTSNLTVTTTNTSTNAVSYVWSFGDAATSTLTNPSHTYSVSGTYTIKLVATNAAGCKDSVSQTITISAKPVAAFTITALTQCLTGGTLQFTDASIGTVTPSYYYDFGDGTLSFLQNPTKAYLAAGTYIVKQIVTNANGCKDSITKNVVVDVKPVASFNVPNFTTCTNTNSITFANTSTNATNYVWSFGDGVDSISANPTHTYAALGTYTVKLVAANSSGCKDSTTRTITLTAKPTAGFTSAFGQNLTQCLTNNSFTYFDNSIGATNYFWNFGDGTTSTLANPLPHKYANAGVYVVKQIVTNINGCKDSTSLTVTVLASPVASFNLIGATSCTANTSITTNNTSTGANNTYAWDLGDGSSSFVTNPSHTYTIAGTYNIKLVATNSITGCKDSVTKPVTFSTNPTAAFTANNSNQCVNNNNFVFTNTSVGGATYFWNFGDATTSTSASPNKIYTSAGVYNVKLIVTTANGCKDSITKVVTVLTKPTALFNVVGTTACSSNLTIALNNTSTGTGNTYVWSFGDGTNSIAANPSKTYTSIGTYTIKLVVANGNGCVDSITQDITISTKPLAAFTVSDTLQCVNGSPIIFTNASTNTVTPAYYYDFGDGTFSLVQNPTKVYTTAGTYIVKMFVTNANGCKDSTTKTIRIVAKPMATFTILNYSSCSNANTSFSFVNTSTNAITYTWDFGDGTTSTLTNPTKNYVTTGTFIVKLVATNANGCKDSTTQTISLIPKPVAGFVYSSTGLCSNNTFTFTDTSKVNGTPNYYYWDFGDGTFSLLQNPTKAFLTAGTYKVTLFVTNTNGCKDSASKTIVIATKPTAAFTIPSFDSCSNNNTLKFTNASTNATSYVWSFGDGVDSTSTSPTHTYLGLGTYIVKLVAVNTSGCKDSTTRTINLISKPVAGFTYTSTGLCSNNTFTFTDTSKVAGTPSYYYWDFGDGTFSLLKNPTKAFTTAGTYKVLLFVTNANGCKDSTSKTLTILTKPTASFTIPSYNGCGNATSAFAFTNTSTNATSYVWSFGDGVDSTSKNPSHTYTSIGTYTVKLVATNASGCKDSTTQTITLISKPVAGFTYSSSGLCSNNTFTFNDTSKVTGTPSYYYWDFGDGTFSILQNPTKAFTTAGTYKVTLFVTNANGCKDSTNKTIVIATKPTAAFTIPSFDSCSNNKTLKFTNASTNATSYVWSFGDGVDSISTNPTHTYLGLGTYIVKLVAVNTSGCKDSTTRTINLISKPLAGFTYTSTGLCSNNTFTFTDTSKVTGTPSYYYWDFGDGTFSLLKNPTKAFTTAGTYKVLLFVTNANGCKDSTSKTLTILTKPTASFTIPSYNSCSNTSTAFAFTNTSTNATSYVWSFGDGVDSTSKNPTHRYTSIGTYIVKLVTSNASGCKDSTTQTITLIAKPVAGFTYTSTGLCSNNTFTFTDTSKVTGTPSYYYWDFGDGTFSILQNPTKVFTTPGIYKVLLFVTNANGCKDSISKTLTILTKPTASFTIPSYNGCGNISTAFSFANSSTNATSYVWDFGDGTKDTAKLPTKIYSTLGTFIVKLVATNTSGCKDSTTQTITLIAKPVAAFNVNTIGSCTNTVFTFTDASTVSGTPSYYYWDFGDGTTSLLQNPTKSYVAAGTYKVLFFVTNNNGCKDSISKQVTVLATPKAAFTLSNFNPCSNNYTVTTVNGSTNATSYLWDFGDGILTSQTNITKTFTGIGTYTITLVAINASGCTDTARQTISFTAKPIAAFNVSSLGGCVNNSFAFSDNSTASGNPSYYYDFGDGTISLLQNPTHTYTTAGTYKVIFFVTNTNGCKDSTSKTITVTAKPTASFTIPNYTGCGNTSTAFSFANSSTNATSYVWDFGDGTKDTAKLPTKIYSTLGTFIVKLVATNASGCKDSTTQTITLIAKPVAAFNVNATGSCTNTVFTFTDASTVSGTPSYYYWDFGDGTTSLLQNPTKSYVAAGTYKVLFFVTNNNGCKDSISKQVTVLATPKAAFTLSNFNPCSNNYTVTTVNGSTNATSYLWDFGDGILTSQTNITKTFTGIGIYTITLVAINASGCTDTARQTISFTAKPIAAFNVSSLGSCVNNSVAFSDNSTASGNPSYYYDFGDGTISLLQNPTHIYTTAGTYKVIFFVTNTNGCKDSTSRTITVTAKPKASFTTPNIGGCSNNSGFSFTNTSTNATSYIWDFGDGTGATTTNAAKTYSNIGTYTVKLIAINASGCGDTASQTFTIIPKPTASFNVSSLGGCVNNSFAFSDNSSVTGAASYYYDFGDATISLLQNPTHTYTATGTYRVIFFVTNANGCKDSTSRTITVTTKPTASFALSGFVPCSVNNTITFVNSSTNATSYVWNFGDGNGSTLANPTKTYTVAGTYRITLIATNANGCLDSTSQTIKLTSKPTAAFSVSSTSQCLTSNSFSFANGSTGNISGFVWNFGDGTNSTALNPTKTYTAAGTYTVTLTVTNANGCTDVATQVINVSGKPVISYTINNATQCIIGNVFTFTNTSPNQSGITYYWSFGDGILSSLNTISKVYTSTGTFRVTLIATNGNGCIDSLVKTVSVLAKPTPSFIASSNVQCVNNGFLFTNTTSTTTASYTWRFGDGTISNSTNASHSYATSGTYVVTLIASNSGGCVDSVSQTIFVTAKPVASFTIVTTNQCAAGTVVNFNNTTTGSFSSLIWLFSDGTVSTDISPVKTFATAGTYTAKLLVLSSGGCRDSSTQSFTILPKTIASFALSNITQCINNSFTFTSTSTAGLNSLTYKWDLGDGTLASTSTVTKSYLLPGTYNVKLLVVNTTTGCRDSVTAAVKVNAQPTANLAGSGTICSGNSFIINVNLFGTPPYSFTYYDGTTNHTVSGINTAVYGLGVSPTTTTTYRIVAMNDANCNASTADVALTSSTVTVNEATITQQPISMVICIGNTATLSGLATANTAFTYQWQKNGVDILGETNSTLTITNANVLQSGNYRLAVVLPCGRVYSNIAVVTVPNAPAPPAFPSTVALCQFDSAKPLTANGIILRWYTTATGGIASPVPPIPNTLVTGTQQYWVSNSTTDNCESQRYLITVTVRPAPAVTAVALSSTVILPTQTVVLRATPSLNALGVRWYYNGVNIGSTINNEITVDFNRLGKYQAEAITALGCTARSQIIEVTAPGGIASMSEGNNLRLYPNPATSVVNMYFDNPVNENVMVRLVNAWGQVLQTKAVKFTNRFQPITLKVADLRADIYAVEILNSRGLTIARNLFVKAQ